MDKTIWSTGVLKRLIVVIPKKKNPRVIVIKYMHWEIVSFL